MNDTWHMRRALRLAEKGLGWTGANPMVGAVLVKDGERIGEGFHSRFGGPHAEIEALNSCTQDPKGSTLYVTLEPCAHEGKTPPCVEAILQSGISRVLIADLDPSKKVHGKGVALLKQAGLDVEVGLLREEARRMNRFFYTLHEKNRPWVTLKVAMSLDGKISAEADAPTPLTGLSAQRYVHGLRHEHQSILVGAGTVLSDDPHLGVRLFSGTDPLRIVMKGHRELPQTLRIFRDENVLVHEGQKLGELMQVLYEKEVHSILVEGGHDIFSSFLSAGWVDELQVLIAPILLGKEALPFCEVTGSLPLHLLKTKALGPDVLMVYRPKDKSGLPQE